MNNNFDYSRVPKGLLYEDKKHLTDFGVEGSSLLNSLIQKKLFDRFAQFADYESWATQIFNHAYYICTVALVDSHPEWRFGTFMRETENRMHHNDEYVGMVLAIVLLQMWVHRWDMHDHLIAALYKTIEDELRDENKYEDIFKEVFWQITQDLQAKGIDHIEYHDEFRPRPINYRLLKDSWSEMKWLYRDSWDNSNIYEYKDKLLEFIFAIGKNENEQQVIANFLRDQLIKSFENGQEHKWFFDDIDREIHDLHHGEEDRARDQAEFEAYQEQETLAELEAQWNKERVQEQEVEIKKLRAIIESKGWKLDAESTNETPAESQATEDGVAKLKEVIEELKEQIDFFQQKQKAMCKRKDQRAGVAVGLTRNQVAVMGDIIAEKLNLDFSQFKGGRGTAIGLISKHLWGYSAEKLRQASPEKEDREYVASIFAPFSPTLAKEICKTWRGDTPPPWECEE